MPDPIRRFLRWFAEAKAARVREPEACALATVGPGSRPSLRFVLLKRVDGRGFVFFTNVESRKGREMAANPEIALTFYWRELGRQVRIEGRASELGVRESESYWTSRPRESRLSALASRQSERLGSRAELVRRVRELRARYRAKPVPRPGSWKGILLRPRAVEFWTQRPHRLHVRIRYRRADGSWTREMLQP